MEDIIDDNKPTGKVYTEKLIRGATFFGGPIVASYLLAENFKVLGEPDKVSKTWLIGIISTVVVFGFAFLLEFNNVNIPGPVIPIIYTLITIGIYKQQQELKVNTHLQLGGEKYGVGNIVLVTILGLIFTIGILLLIFVIDWSHI